MFDLADLGQIELKAHRLGMAALRNQVKTQNGGWT
jgi:hypothetical protein